MKLRKNLEGVFLVAAVVANFAGYAAASAQANEPVKAVQAAQAVDQAMPVVVVKAHRLSAAEKAALS